MTSRQIILFTKTAAWVHDSVPDGIELVNQRAQEDGVEVVETDDAAVFESAHLDASDAVVFMNTSGILMIDRQRDRLERYVRAGGGFAGIHNPGDAEQDWPTFRDIVGARFVFHPAQQEAVVEVRDHDHPSTSFLPDRWVVEDEWYAWDAPPDARVLLAVDESSYDPGAVRNGDHPICWTGFFGAGRTWYTGLGHPREIYADPLFRQHVWGGIRSVFREERRPR